MQTGIIKCIIFDLDGLIVDTEPVFLSAMQSVLRRYGIEVSEADYIAKDLQNGTSVLEYLLSTGQLPAIAPVQLEIYDRYFDLLRIGVREMPGAAEAIRRLGRGFVLAIASSSKEKFISYILEELSLSKCFSIVVSRESTKNLKPEPDCLEVVLRQASLLPGECVLIEDSRRGLAAARMIGMPCIVVPNELTKGGDYSGAVAVLSSLADLTSDLILSL